MNEYLLVANSKVSVRTSCPSANVNSSVKPKQIFLHPGKALVLCSLYFFEVIRVFAYLQKEGSGPVQYLEFSKYLEQHDYFCPSFLARIIVTSSLSFLLYSPVYLRLKTLKRVNIISFHNCKETPKL